MAEVKEKTLNIYEKIQKVKLELSKCSLKKSGINKFAGYKYYELGDFLPVIVQLCQENGLFTKIEFSDQEASLIILDTDSKNAITKEDGSKEFVAVKYTSPMRTLEMKGANAIQALGGVQTYLRRYLYMNAFDIVEADMWDGGDLKNPKNKTKNKELNDIIDKCVTEFSNSDETVKKKVGALMRAYGYDNFADLRNAQDKEHVSNLANTLGIKVDVSTTNKGKK